MVTRLESAVAAPERTRRNPAATRERMLAAVRQIIEQDGLAGVGINAIARMAGVDKVLIYRQFGGLDGLFAAFAAEADLWWTVEELVAGIDPGAGDAGAALKTILARHAAALRDRPLAQAVLAAELTERGPLVAEMQAVRERRALELNAWLLASYPLPPGQDWPALILLLGAAVNYLVIRSATPVMGAVPIASDAGWQRLMAAAEAMIDAMFPPTSAPPSERPCHG